MAELVRVRVKPSRKVGCGCVCCQRAPEHRCSGSVLDGSWPRIKDKISLEEWQVEGILWEFDLHNASTSSCSGRCLDLLSTTEEFTEDVVRVMGGAGRAGDMLSGSALLSRSVSAPVWRSGPRTRPWAMQFALAVAKRCGFAFDFPVVLLCAWLHAVCVRTHGRRPAPRTVRGGRVSVRARRTAAHRLSV